MRLFNGETLPRPRYRGLESFDPQFWQKKFPTDLEIGCGTGQFALGYADQNPERRLIAIEHTRERFEKFQNQYSSVERVNLFPIHANAISYVYFEIPDYSLENIYFFYPNPEPKNPSARWFQMPFFSVLLQKLKSNGRIQLVSNLKEYSLDAHHFAETVWKLKKIESRELNAKDSMSPRTLFEKKYLERGDTCYDQIWIKEPNHAE